MASLTRQRGLTLVSSSQKVRGCGGDQNQRLKGHMESFFSLCLVYYLPSPPSFIQPRFSVSAADILEMKGQVRQGDVHTGRLGQEHPKCKPVLGNVVNL